MKRVDEHTRSYVQIGMYLRASTKLTGAMKSAPICFPLRTIACGPMFPLDFPPDGGIVGFEVPVAPVSFQATSIRKKCLITTIQSLVSPCRYLLSGDVKLTIEWLVSERARYESDSSADVDNIIKPILDALCGPDGLIIDDCQIQELTCYWTHLHSCPERLYIELRFQDDIYLIKEGLVFLDIGKGLYFPFYDDVPRVLGVAEAEEIIARFHCAPDPLDPSSRTESYRLLRPLQRLFHKSKITSFRMTSLAAIRAQLIGEKASRGISDE